MAPNGGLAHKHPPHPPAHGGPTGVPTHPPAESGISYSGTHSSYLLVRGQTSSLAQGQRANITLAHRRVVFL